MSDVQPPILDRLKMTTPFRAIFDSSSQLPRLTRLEIAFYSLRKISERIMLKRGGDNLRSVSEGVTAPRAEWTIWFVDNLVIHHDFPLSCSNCEILLHDLHRINRHVFPEGALTISDVELIVQVMQIILPSLFLQNGRPVNGKVIVHVLNKMAATIPMLRQVGVPKTKKHEALNFSTYADEMKTATGEIYTSMIYYLVNYEPSLQYLFAGISLPIRFYAYSEKEDDIVPIIEKESGDFDVDAFLEKHQSAEC